MDMLVKLYELPAKEPVIKKMKDLGIKIETAFPPNRRQIVDFVSNLTGTLAASEADCCFGKTSPSIYVARRGNELLGYACYDATAPDFFGPTEVLSKEQKKGIGKALLLSALHAMKEEGYAYAIIGSVGPEEFYKKAVGAIEIEGSTPGIYEKMIPLE